jgi:hypothetical protein
MALRTIFEQVSTRLAEATFALSPHVDLGPAAVSEVLTIADTETLQVLTASLQANRRYLCELFLSGTGEDGTEYAQWLHVVAATDGSTVTASGLEPMRTLLNSVISPTNTFPFTVSLSSTGLSLEVSLVSTAGQAVHIAGSMRFESWVQPAGFEPSPSTLCFLLSGSPGEANITLNVSTTTASGVAPLYVHFSTVGTTATLTDHPFEDLDYCWEFGDADPGNWGPTGHSKNDARGPLAGHVYENPGTYEVMLHVRDALGREVSTTIEITVTDPDVVFSGTGTVCFSSSGDFTGAPAGSVHVTTSDISDMYDYIPGAKRMLLRRGDTFTSPTGSFVLDKPGPGIIGAFGTGDRPLVTPTIVGMYCRTDEGAIQWRVMDIEFDGGDVDSTRGIQMFGSTAGDFQNAEFLMLRVKIAHVGVCFTLSGDIVGMVDCELRENTGGSGQNIIYGFGSRLFLAGTTLWDSTDGEHVLRLARITDSVVSNSLLGMAPSPRHLVKIHAETGFDTERLVFSDCRLYGEGGTDWPIDFGPKNDTSDERLKDVIFERNFVMCEVGVTSGLNMRGTDMVARNNVFIARTGTDLYFIGIGQRGIEPPPLRVKLSHNTVYALDGTARFAIIGAECDEVSAYNNLAASPSTPLWGLSGLNTTESDNQGFSGLSLTTSIPAVLEDGRLDLGQTNGSSTERSTWDVTLVPRPETPLVGAFQDLEP